jgi:hypothetical protein
MVYFLKWTQTRFGVGEEEGSVESPEQLGWSPGCCIWTQGRAHEIDCSRVTRQSGHSLMAQTHCCGAVSEAWRATQESDGIHIACN